MLSSIPPPAIVTKWNNLLVYVRCPYCKREHCHDIGPKPYTGRRREAPCEKEFYSTQREYYPQYPYEEGASEHYSSRIDQESRMWVTVGVSLENFEDEDGYASDDTVVCLETPTPNTNPKEGFRERLFTELLTEERQTLLLYWGLCARNNVEALKDLFRVWKKDLFITAIDKNGDNGIARAAMAGAYQVISFLHEQGCEVDRSNKRGRTPLMEAALWGYYEIVKFLLEHGANPTATDRDGRTALDLATESKDNTKSRRWRAQSRTTQSGTTPSRRIRGRKSCPGYDTESNWLEYRRDLICKRLKQHSTSVSTPVPIQTPSPRPRYFETRLEPPNQFIDVFEHRFEHTISAKTKVMALLKRPCYPDVGAVSGWENHKQDGIVVPNTVWTPRVLQLFKLVGHTPWYCNPDLDKGVGECRGRFYASHAEKQVVAFFLTEHVLEYVLDVAKAEKDWETYEKLKTLKEVQPPSPPGCVIDISTNVCGDCESFLGHVKRTYNVQMVLRSRSPKTCSPLSARKSRNSYSASFPSATPPQVSRNMMSARVSLDTSLHTSKTMLPTSTSFPLDANQAKTEVREQEHHESRARKPLFPCAQRRLPFNTSRPSPFNLFKNKQTNQDDCEFRPVEPSFLSLNTTTTKTKRASPPALKRQPHKRMKTTTEHGSTATASTSRKDEEHQDQQSRVKTT